MTANTAIPPTSAIAIPAFAPEDRPVWAESEVEESEVAATVGTEDVTDFERVVCVTEDVDSDGTVEEVFVNEPVDVAESADDEALVSTPRTPMVVIGSSEAWKCVVLKSVAQSQDPP